jgi:hypothetical protein
LPILTAALNLPRSSAPSKRTKLCWREGKQHARSRRERFVVEEGFAGAATGETVVQGVLDRNLRQVRATVVPNVARETLQNEILKNVKYGTKVHTDSAVAYDQGMQWRFVHEMVNKTESFADKFTSTEWKTSGRFGPSVYSGLISHFLWPGAKKHDAFSGRCSKRERH